MSNARSPREVCSTTMGTNGLIDSSLLAAWGPQFRAGRGLLLLRRPDALARLVQVGRDRLDLGRDAVEGLLEAEVVADPVGAALLDELLDVGLVLAGVAQLLPDLVVGDLEPELLGDRLEHELAADRLRRLGAQTAFELGRVLAGDGEVRVRVDATRLEAAGEAREELARARLDQRPGGVHVRRSDELVDRSRTEDALDLLLDLAAQTALDVGLQLVERLELGGGARQLVVERRQHLLLQLLDGDRRLTARPVAQLVGDL